MTEIDRNPLIEEISGTPIENVPITDQQLQHLEAIDIWLDDLLITMEEMQEYGVWGAQFRRAERRDFPQYHSKR